MHFSKKAAALAAGAMTALSLVSLAQDQGAPTASADRGRQIVVGGHIDWVEKSDVSALKEGVLENIEFGIGRVVKKGQEIGKLHSEIAELTEAKAKLAAANVGEVRKAEAQVKVTRSAMARILRLKAKGPGNVSIDDEEKAAAELTVSEANLTSAKEQQGLAKADHDLALQALKEHRIIAPFDGVITDKMKSPGEAVRANEAVVRLGRTDTLRFVGWVPLETAVRIKGNEIIDVRPVIDGAELKVEDLKFRGNLTSVSHELNTVRATEVQVIGEIKNPPNPEHPELELRQGMRAEMTIYLDGAPAKVAVTRGNK